MMEGQWDPGWLGNSVDLGPYFSVLKTRQLVYLYPFQPTA